MVKNGDVNSFVNNVEATRTAREATRAPSAVTRSRARDLLHHHRRAKAAVRGNEAPPTPRSEPYRLQDLHARLRHARAEPVSPDMKPHDPRGAELLRSELQH